MFENLIINLKSKIAYKPTSIYGFHDDGDQEYGGTPKFAATEFLSNLLTGRFRYASVNQHNNDDTGYRNNNRTCMLPRVYAQESRDYDTWGPVDLAPNEQFVEDLDNVIDKFIRVISVDDGTIRYKVIH